MERFEQDEDAFSIVDQSEIMEAMSGVTNTMSLMIRTNRVFYLEIRTLIRYNL